MKVSCSEGIANHTGPESCGGARKGVAEALTGECAGRVLSREIYGLPRERQVLRDADAVRRGGRQYLEHRYRKVSQSPARSETPCMHRNTSCGNREIPRPSAEVRAADRIGKSRDVSR